VDELGIRATNTTLDSNLAGPQAPEAVGSDLRVMLSCLAIVGARVPVAYSVKPWKMPGSRVQWRQGLLVQTLGQGGTRGSEVRARD